jgi:hypothetical protein
MGKSRGNIEQGTRNREQGIRNREGGRQVGSMNEEG